MSFLYIFANTVGLMLCGIGLGKLVSWLTLRDRRSMPFAGFMIVSETYAKNLLPSETFDPNEMDGYLNSHAIYSRCISEMSANYARGEAIIFCIYSVKTGKYRPSFIRYANYECRAMRVS